MDTHKFSAGSFDLVISIQVLPRALPATRQPASARTAVASTTDLPKVTGNGKIRPTRVLRSYGSPRGTRTKQKCHCRYLNRKVLIQHAAERGFVAPRGQSSGGGSLNQLGKKLSLYGPRARHAGEALAHDSSGKKPVAPERIAYIAEKLGATPTSISRPYRAPHTRCYPAGRRLASDVIKELRTFAD